MSALVLVSTVKTGQKNKTVDTNWHCHASQKTDGANIEIVPWMSTVFELVLHNVMCSSSIKGKKIVGPLKALYTWQTLFIPIPTLRRIQPCCKYYPETITHIFLPLSIARYSIINTAEWTHWIGVERTKLPKF